MANGGFSFIWSWQDREMALGTLQLLPALDHPELLAEPVATALRTLPVEQQTLLELHYWDGLDAAALAEVFESNAAAIRNRLHRAREKLREAMLATEGIPPDTVATPGGTDVHDQPLHRGRPPGRLMGRSRRKRFRLYCR